MKAISLLAAEFVSIAKHKALLFTVIGALFIPVIFAIVQVSATWSPYDQLSNLPVAIVNNDMGTTQDGEDINVGEDLVNDLKGNDGLNWNFVSSAEAKKGLENLKYYLVIEIPEDFSSNLTTVLDANPKKMELNYIQNEGLNFFASQVTRSATGKLKESLANKITENYTKKVFGNLAEIGAGFQLASDGSKQLFDGTTKLNDGTSEMLTSLQEKAGDISKLASGAGQVNDGTVQILSSLKEKSSDISKLASGAKTLEGGTTTLFQGLKAKEDDVEKLAAGAKSLEGGTMTLLKGLQAKEDDVEKLAAGAKALEGGTTTLLKGLQAKEDDVEKLAAGAKALQQGSTGLHTGISQVLAGLKEAGAGTTQLEQGTGSLVAGIKQWHGGSVQVADGASSLSLGLQEFQKAYPGLDSNENFKALVEASKQVAAGSNALSTSALEIKAGVEGVDGGLKQLAGSFPVFIAGQTQLETGAAQLEGGATQLAAGTSSVNSGWKDLISGVSQLQGGSVQLSAGTSSVNSGWKQLISGVSQLQGGTVQLSAGTSSVDTGWQTLTAGVSQLQQGTVQVKDGTSTVNTGWGGLTDGVTLLNDGTGQLKAGSEELYTKLNAAATEVGGLQVSDPNYQMFASPVQTFEERINPLPQYRNSTAPYNVSLALFIGALAMSLIVNLTTPIKYTNSGVAFFVSKFLKFSILALIQAGLVSIVTLGVLGLEVQSGIQFVLFTMLMSVTFASIVFFFVSLAGHLGRIIVFGFIVLQLNTTGGQLPIELLPASLQSISKFAPLTYSIAGLKSIISLGSLSYVILNALVLLGFLVVFTSLSALTVIIKHRKALNNNELDHLEVA